MNEAHERFHAWLTAGADGDPARDLAVHASVCAGCRQSMAAVDLFALVDTGLASMPSLQPVAARRGPAGRGRLAGAAAGVVLGAVILGIGASQLIALSRGNPGGPIARASQTPDQGVLGTQHTARPTTSSQPSSGETLTPLPTLEPTTQPGGSNATPRATPRSTPRATPRSSPLPTSNPTPTPSPGPTGTSAPSPVPTAMPTPVPTATPTPTPVPTPVPTPTPIEPGAPTLDSAIAVSATEVDLSWSAPGNGGSPITNYRIYRDGFAIQTVGNVTFYPDATASSATIYLYEVAAINTVGEGPRSNAIQVTTP